MDRRRRQVLAGASAGLAVGLAGCLGGPLEYDATAATVDRVALQEAGYDPYRTAEVVFERAFGPGPLERTLTVRSAVAEFDRAIELPAFGRLQAGVFAVMSTPQVRVLGHGFNPVGDMSTDQLAEAIQEHYGAIRQLTHDADLSMDLLESETPVTRFRGWADLLPTGAAIGIYLYVSEAVASEDDYVIGLAVHPRLVDPRDGTVSGLMEGVTHPATE